MWYRRGSGTRRLEAVRLRRVHRDPAVVAVGGLVTVGIHWNDRVEWIHDGTEDDLVERIRG